MNYEKNIPIDVINLLSLEESSSKYIFGSTSVIEKLESRLSSEPVRNDPSFELYLEKTFGFSLFAILFSSILFGSLHMIAWNFAFPTHVEQILWRTASLCITTTVPLCLLTGVILVVILGEILSGTYFNSVLNQFGRAFVALYTIARLYLLVEIFRTLFFLPPEAFISTWSTNIPHFS